MNDMLRRLTRWVFVPPLTAPRATLLLRVMAGGVFLSEGILKFVYTNQGVGRFAKLGLPAPEFTATFVGCLEIVGGLLLLLGLLTRAFAIAFIIEMIVAILSTKIALYLGTSPLALPPSPPKVGFWAVMHEIRSEYAQLLTCAFLLIVGPGAWSLDAVLRRQRSRARSSFDPAPAQPETSRHLATHPGSGPQVGGAP
jgi:putative oxidoreductase